MSRRLSDCTSPRSSPGAVHHSARSLQPAKTKTKGKLQLVEGLEAAAWQAGARGSPAREVLLKANGRLRWRLLSVLLYCSYRALETANVGANPARSPRCELSLCSEEALTRSSWRGRCCPAEQPLPHARRPATGLRLGPGIPRRWPPTEGPAPAPKWAGAAPPTAQLLKKP